MKTSTWRTWLERLSHTFPGGTQRRRRTPHGRGKRPQLERLEDRALPSVTIAPTNNSGNGYAALSIDQAPDANAQYWVPPDTNGAAGPTNFIETVNSSVAIYSPKATGATKVEDNFIHFWGTVGGLPTADSGAFYSDCAVVYDDNIPGGTPATGRFIVTDTNVDTSTGKSVFDIAVSKSASPATLTAADWNFYQINTAEAGGLWSDYPGNLGYNQDALVVTFNMFSPTVFSGHAQVNALSISNMVNGVPNRSLTHTQTDVTGMSLRPATEHTAAAGAPEWLVSETGDGSHINVYQMTKLLTTPSISAPTQLAVTAYSGVVAPLQPNGTAITTNIDSRIQKAALSGNTLVAAHAISVSSTQDDIQWYKIDVSGATPVLSDQGRVGAGANTYLVYPAIDINSSGTIGMSYSRSGTDSSTDFMSAYITGRTSSDAAGTMETPVLVPAGTGTINDTLDGREGDLSGINLDPSDGSFWGTAEYATPSTVFAQGSWGTAVANFTVGPTSTATADLSVTNTGPPTATEGANNLTYTMGVTNGGPDSATGTVLTDTLGANLKFISATTSQGTFTQSGSTVTFNLGTLANGGTATVTVTAQATEDGSLSNSASVTSNASDPTPGDNTKSATTTVSEPAINPAVTTITTSARKFSGTVATFTHANGVEPASAFSATINWGDGKTSPGTITESGTTYTVTGSHSYKKPGTHTITTTVKETGNAPNFNSPAAATTGSGDSPLLATSIRPGTNPTTRLLPPVVIHLSGHPGTRPPSDRVVVEPGIRPSLVAGLTNPGVAPAQATFAGEPGLAADVHSGTTAAELHFNFGAQGLGAQVTGEKPRSLAGSRAVTDWGEAQEE
jgi:uncharacterized repeat protein (TIGR01451 family)